MTRRSVSEGRECVARQGRRSAYAAAPLRRDRLRSGKQLAWVASPEGSPRRSSPERRAKSGGACGTSFATGYSPRPSDRHSCQLVFLRSNIISDPVDPADSTTCQRISARWQKPITSVCAPAGATTCPLGVERFWPGEPRTWWSGRATLRGPRECAAARSVSSRRLQSPRGRRIRRHPHRRRSARKRSRIHRKLGPRRRQSSGLTWRLPSPRREWRLTHHPITRRPHWPNYQSFRRLPPPSASISTGSPSAARTAMTPRKEYFVISIVRSAALSASA